ncbi:MAG: endonuclease V [Cetobacterium sp.]
MIKTYGCSTAVKSTRKPTNPIYVSIGNGISLSTCIQIVNSVCEYRIPEPVRHADLKTRVYLRIKIPIQSY